MVDMSIVCGILQLVGVADQLRNGGAPPCVDLRIFQSSHQLPETITDFDIDGIWKCTYCDSLQ